MYVYIHIDMSVKRHSTIKLFSEKELFGEERSLNDIDLGILQMQILWLLSRKSSHGYNLMKDLSKIKNNKITQGTLYPTLQKLVFHGFIKHENIGRKKVYHITEKGNKVMHDACLDFCRTFYGIYQDFVCKSCAEHRKK